MKLTAKQRKELVVLKHFIPANCTFRPITDDDIACYFAWSDKGIGKADVERLVGEEGRQRSFSGLAALYYAKRYREVAVAGYMEDWGTYCNAMDFVDEPREVAEYVAKAINKPAVMTMWKLHNEPREIDDNDREILEPLRQLAEMAS